LETGSFAEVIWKDLEIIRRRRPLIHNITNFVVMNETANALLAVGGSPVMAHAAEEVGQMAGIADALVLNIGTLWPDLVDAMIVAGKAANRKGIPVVLDPVGVGATDLRTASARRIMSEVDVTLVRANQAEAMALAGMDSVIRGVDSVSENDSFASTAIKISQQLGCAVAVTGKTDVITDGSRTYLCSNGHSMLQNVTGTGCTATALCGCFLAVCPDVVRGAAEALAFFGLCGELAALTCRGPGSFEMNLRDRLYSLSLEDLVVGTRVQSL
jgi:hydroxyethylthiazole kinase